MSTGIEIRLLELNVDHNGLSKANLRKVTNLLEAILHFPNLQNPKALAIKSMNLWSGKEYLAEAVHYYEDKLDKRKPALPSADKQRLMDYYRQEQSIDATLFKIAIEGKPKLEINVSLAEDNPGLENVLKKSFGVAV